MRVSISCAMLSRSGAQGMPGAAGIARNTPGIGTGADKTSGPAAQLSRNTSVSARAPAPAPDCSALRAAVSGTGVVPVTSTVSTPSARAAPLKYNNAVAFFGMPRSAAVSTAVSGFSIRVTRKPMPNNASDSANASFRIDSVGTPPASDATTIATRSCAKARSCVKTSVPQATISAISAFLATITLPRPAVSGTRSSVPYAAYPPQHRVPQ